MYVCMYVCMYLCMHMFIRVYVCMYVSCQLVQFVMLWQSRRGGLATSTTVFSAPMLTLTFAACGADSTRQASFFGFFGFGLDFLFWSVGEDSQECRGTKQARHESMRFWSDWIALRRSAGSSRGVCGRSMHACVYIHVCSMYTYIYIYVYVYVYTCVCMYVCMCASMHLCMNAYIYMYTYTHVHLCSCIYVYVNTNGHNRVTNK